MTARKTVAVATTATATRKPRVSRSKAVKGVSLARTAPKRSMAGNTDYSGFVRALWNMGDAAETATTVDTNGNVVLSESARRYYSIRRDELLSTFAQYL